MTEYAYTDYFENEVLRKRPYLKKEWCVRVIENPLRIERQENNRFRYWGKIEACDGKVLRVRDVENINVPSIAWIRVDFARLAISKCEGIVSYFELFEMANRTKAT